jgi:hypothetical protein
MAIVYGEAAQSDSIRILTVMGYGYKAKHGPDGFSAIQKTMD